eukprot:scaffold212094_cov40-Tisochrysis_lutea.AAC.1
MGWGRACCMLPPRPRRAVQTAILTSKGVTSTYPAPFGPQAPHGSPVAHTAMRNSKENAQTGENITIAEG